MSVKSYVSHIIATFLPPFKTLIFIFQDLFKHVTFVYSTLEIAVISTNMIDSFKMNNTPIIPYEPLKRAVRIF